MSKRGRLFALALLAVALPAPSAVAADANVQIQGFAFRPSTITVLVGSTVEWENLDGFAHTVTENGGAFSSGSLGQGQKYARAFTVAGTVGYHCAFHPSMTGVVNVVTDLPAEPDLVVSAMTAENVDFRTKRLRATVTNSGLSAAAASTLRFTYGASRFIADATVPALVVGGSAQVQTLWDVFGKAGTFSVSAQADAGGVVTEANEENNVKTVTTVVLIPGPPIDLTPPPGDARARASSLTTVAVDAHTFIFGSTYYPGDNSPKLPEIVVFQGNRLFVTNLDISAGHTLVSMEIVGNEPLFASDNAGIRQTKEVFGVPSLEPRSYGFLCVLHPDMQGTLVVEPSIGG